MRIRDDRAEEDWQRIGGHLRASRRSLHAGLLTADYISRRMSPAKPN